MAIIDASKIRAKVEKEKRYRRRRKRMENSDVVIYTIRIPTHLHKRFKLFCTENSVPMKNIVVELVTKYLDEKQNVHPVEET